MLKIDTITQKFKASGHRVTKLRQIMVQLFIDHHLPLSINEITAYLKAQDLEPNKTSIYRELEFLTNQKIIQPIDFGEGKKRYELFNPENHHHHLVCETCDKVEEIHLDQHLLAQERDILKHNKFKVTKHMLEFFGLCQSCQKKEGA